MGKIRPAKIWKYFSPVFVRYSYWVLVFSIPLVVIGQDDYSRQRELMVMTQIAPRDVTDSRTLDAMRQVPRHLFVPEEIRQFAYQDTPLPIGNEQTISQPFMVAFMTQELKPKPHFKVLEIGTGSGYQAAVLAEIVDQVYTMEIVEPLGQATKSLLGELGYTNINVRIGDGYHGWPEQAPFDAIIVTAGAEEIPPALVDQLKDGGRMVIPLGKSGARQLVRVTKKKGKIKTKNLMAVRFVPFTRKN